VKGKIVLLTCLVVVLVLSVAATAFAVPMNRTFRADLVELNGSGVVGTAEVVMLPQNQLRVRVWAWGLVPDIMHGLHVHGFKNGDPATIPPPDNMYGDGIISLDDATVYTGPSLLACRPFPRADCDGYVEYTRVFRGDDLKELQLDKVSLAKRAIMLRGGFIPATYYGPAFVQTLPVAVGLLDGPYMQP
jgi:hypothetical protein